MSANHKDKYATISGHLIRYQTHGSGPEVLLLIHGAVGSINDFALQIDEKNGLDLKKFTIVLPDMLGYGKSSSIQNDFKTDPTMDYFKRCADTMATLMGQLNHKTYSVGGWSDGARVACCMAIKYQSRVNSLLIWSFLPLMDAQSSWAIAKTRDVSTWDPDALKFYTDCYGELQFKEKWRKYVDYLVSSLDYPSQFDVRSELDKIKCPTMILHGSEDPIVDYKEHVEPLEAAIYDSDINQLTGLSHNLHQSSADQFNLVATNFITGLGVC